MSQASATNLGSLVFRGVRWKLGSQVAVQLVRLVTAFLVARMLTPTQYGLAAMVLSFSGFVLAFSDLGLGAALVQRQRLQRGERSTVFWTNVGSGLVFTFLGLACASLLASLYGDPQARPLFAVYSLAFVIAALGATPRSLLIRAMNFPAIEGRTLIATIVGSVVGITLAVAGAGAWSIVLQQLAITSVSTIIVWFAVPWRPSFRFSFARLRGFWRFSGGLLGNQLFFFANEAGIAILVSRLLGAAALGTFAVGYTLVLVPFTRLAMPLAEVLFPAFSRLQDDPARLAAAWLRATRALAVIVVPALLGLAVVAPEFVVVVLGTKWEGAVPVVQILASVGLFQALQSWSAAVLLARGRSGTLFGYTVLFFAANLLGVAIGAQWGIVGVAAGYAAAAAVTETIFLVITARVAGVSVFALPRALAGVFVAAGLMAAVVLGVGQSLEAMGAAPTVRLVLMILAGVVAYIPLCWQLVPDVRDEILRRLGRRRAKTAVPA